MSRSPWWRRCGTRQRRRCAPPRPARSGSTPARRCSRARRRTPFDAARADAERHVQRARVNIRRVGSPPQRRSHRPASCRDTRIPRPRHCPEGRSPQQAHRWRRRGRAALAASGQPRLRERARAIRLRGWRRFSRPLPRESAGGSARRPVQTSTRRRLQRGAPAPRPRWCGGCTPTTARAVARQRSDHSQASRGDHAVGRSHSAEMPKGLVRTP